MDFCAKATINIEKNYVFCYTIVEKLKDIAVSMEIDEIHIFDETGCIFAGTNPEYYGLTLDSGEQVRFFYLC